MELIAVPLFRHSFSTCGEQPRISDEFAKNSGLNQAVYFPAYHTEFELP